MTEAIQKPSGGVTYYTLSDEQLRDYAKEVGVEFNEEQAKFTPDTKNEYQPLAYWLKKLNVNRSTVWRWQKQGLVTPRYVGKKLFFCQADIDELFAHQKS